MNYPVIDLSIYITHGGLPVMKGIARLLHKPEKLERNIYIVVRNERYFILNDAYAIQEPNIGLDEADLISSLQKITKNTPTRLCCDANLTIPNHPAVTMAVSHLIEAIQPHEVILFSGNEACVADATAYLQDQPNTNNLILPHSVTRGFAANQRQLSDKIRDNPLGVFLTRSIQPSTHTKADESDTPNIGTQPKPSRYSTFVMSIRHFFDRTHRVSPINEPTEDTPDHPPKSSDNKPS